MLFSIISFSCLSVIKDFKHCRDFEDFKDLYFPSPLTVNRSPFNSRFHF